TEIHCDADNVEVYGDERHLTECFVNLILNAVEALKIKNEAGARIDIMVIVEENLVQVDVQDNGTGIEYKNLTKIFRPFSSTKSNSRGGVGLNYVSNVIKQHHGEIRVKSVVGKYTLFQIVLPMYRKR
ncbi:MAG: ATP-binding protein, partial [Clostridiales bacterium]|nr:ATP-binding protein [Clostridiales bacterium]